MQVSRARKTLPHRASSGVAWARHLTNKCFRISVCLFGSPERLEVINEPFYWPPDTRFAGEELSGELLADGLGVDESGTYTGSVSPGGE